MSSFSLMAWRGLRRLCLAEIGLLSHSGHRCIALSLACFDPKVGNSTTWKPSVYPGCKQYLFLSILFISDEYGYKHNEGIAKHKGISDGSSSSKVKAAAIPNNCRSFGRINWHGFRAFIKSASRVTRHDDSPCDSRLFAQAYPIPSHSHQVKFAQIGKSSAHRL